MTKSVMNVPELKDKKQHLTYSFLGEAKIKFTNFAKILENSTMYYENLLLKNLNYHTVVFHR